MMSLDHNDFSVDSGFEDRCTLFISQFESYLSDCLSVLDKEILPFATDAALTGGKRIRPLLVYFFSEKIGELKEDTLKASVIIELVHLATLIHDDILDNAKVRRNRPTLHTQIGQDASVLLGDALFAYALELASEFSSTIICSIVARATR